MLNFKLERSPFVFNGLSIMRKVILRKEVAMEDLMNVASYIYNRYANEFNCRIDEMKLHKLLYFAQRESLIQCEEPLFDAVFYGWKYGPVLKEIQSAYKNNSFYPFVPKDVISNIESIVNQIFKRYARKDSWSLSRLTCGEYCWKQSRQGISDGDNGNMPIKLNDIRVDADHICKRREFLVQFGLN